MVHGDLRGVRKRSNAYLSILLMSVQPNILVDDSGCPRIADFGVVIVAHTRYSTVIPSSEMDRNIRWTAPELFDGQEAYTKEADVFSFAMVMVEVRCR